MSGRVDIVIVNWNAGRQLADCIASIDSYNCGQVVSVTVVDNGSRDGSEQVVSAHIPLRVIAAGSNLGFARACNLGATGGSGDYVLLLNPDTLLNAETLATAVGFAECDASADVGVVGIRLHGSDGVVQKHVARFPTAAMFVSSALGLTQLLPRRFPGLFVDDDHQVSRDVDHVIGAFYLVRRQLWENLGGLDHAFFVYLEDLDFSLRVYQAGYRVHYLAEATAFHRGGGTSDQVKAHRLKYSLQSRIVYAAKHMSLVGLIAVAATAIAVEPVVRLLDQGLRRSTVGVRDTWLGYTMVWRELPALLRRVRTVRRRNYRGRAASARCRTTSGA